MTTADQEPTYPEYPQLAARAAELARGFVSPQHLATYIEVVRRRGCDWCCAVLGRPFAGVRTAPTFDAHLLVLADAADLNPPLPQQIVDERAAAQARAEDLTARRAALWVLDEQRWQAARTSSGVDLEVRENTRGRRTGTGLDSSPLRHAVPVRDAWSGTRTRPRQHPAGRAVCETVGRAKPRVLGDPVEAPATCHGCLKLVPQLRAEP